MIVLVNPNNKILSTYAAVEPPLWAGVLASHYRELEKEVRIVDAEALNMTAEEAAVAVLSYLPSMVVLVVMGNNPSVSSTPKMVVAKQLVDRLKEYTEVQVAGLHPSALPDETEKELGCKVIRGKGFTGLPPVAWDLLPMNLYKAHFWHCLDGRARTPYASIYTSLGCPYNCHFCNIHALYGERRISYREPGEVLKELTLLQEKYGVRNIKFWDEMFTFNELHVEAVCDGIIQKNLGLNIWAYARVDSVAPNLLNKMKQAGINWLAYGFEAGSNKVLNNNSKHANKKDAIEAVKMTHKAGINIIGNFIFNLPGDTLETMRNTLDFAKSLNIEFANFYDFHPYPGSELYKENKEWADYEQYGKPSEFRDKAFIEYFTDINYLKNIKNKFGTVAVKRVLEMVTGGKPKTVSGEAIREREH